MKQIIFKIRCNLKDKEYQVGDVYKPKKGDMPLINRLNEKGFIEPLNEKELLEIANSFNFKKKKKEESLNEQL